MSGGVAGTMDHLELKLSNFINLAIFPIAVHARWGLEIKSKCGPPFAGHTYPGCLFGKCLIDKLVSSVKHDVRAGLKFFKGCHAADVIQMRVSDGDCLQFKSVLVDSCNDSF